MRKRTFLPQAGSLPGGNDRHRPVYRWYRESNWSFVPGKLDYPSAAAAREAADDYLAAAMNNHQATEAGIAPSRLETAITGSITAWREKRDGETEAERLRVFGSDGPSTVMSNGREVKIERRRRKACS